MSKHHDWNHDPCRIPVIKLKLSVTEKQKTKGVCVEKIQLASKLYHFIICGLESWVKLWIREKLVVLRFVQKVREKSASTQPKLHQIPETLRKMCFCLFTSVGQKKILSPHEESNLRPSDSAHWCSTTEPQRLHGERGQLRSSSFNLLWKIFWKIYHFGRYTSWQKQVNLMKYQMLSAWSGLVSVHKNVNHRLRELCYVQTL